MKNIYPVFFTKTDTVILVEVPDLEILTEGKDMVNAVEMARDAIELKCVSMEDNGMEIPLPSEISELDANNGTFSKDGFTIISLVDIDSGEYRRKIDTKTVRRNVALPSWLNYEAEHAGINVSRVLQEALMNVLNVKRNVMKMQMISYEEYKETVIQIYTDLRREGYYYNLLVSLFEECITCDMKVIPVYLNTGYKDDAVTKFHDRSKYADSHSLQDIIIVPKEYEYENTTPPYISIEVKKPDITFKNSQIIRYESPKVEGENLEQVQGEFRHCKYIIFTDCITWYFLKDDDKIYKPDICLIDDKQWKQDKTIWYNLKEQIKKIINESKSINVAFK